MNILEIATKAARKAGNRIKELRPSGTFEYQLKADVTLVTAADIEAEKIIITAIRESFPEHAFLSEEASPTLSSESLLQGPLWVIDPVDGTTNYAYGQFQVGVSIAYAEAGQVLAGVVYAPFYDELFSAVLGRGAFLNGKPLRVRPISALDSAIIGTGFQYARDNNAELASRVYQVLCHCRDIRRIGAATLDITWIAAGRLDGFYETLSPWDVAAAGLIAREAGALWGHLPSINVKSSKAPKLPNDLNGANLLVAAPGIFEQLRTILVSAH